MCMCVYVCMGKYNYMYVYAYNCIENIWKDAQKLFMMISREKY